MIALDYHRLSADSKEYLQGYLQAVVPAQDIDCDPLVLLRACQAHLRGERSDYAEWGSIAYALGWAHALGWMPQPDIDQMLDSGLGKKDAILMRWEFGRVEALEQFCYSKEEVHALWVAAYRAMPEKYPSSH